MRILILWGLLLSSCNIIETLTDGETKLEDEFFQSDKRKLDLTPGLIEFWRFEEPTGGNKVSLNGAILVDRPQVDTAMGVPVVSGPRGKAVDCSVNSTGIYSLENSSFSHTVNIGDFITFSFFVKQKVADPTDESIEISASNQSIFEISSDEYGGSAGTDIRVVFGAENFFFYDIIPLNQWVHIAVTIDNNTSVASSSLYVNGQSVGTVSGSAGAITTINGINSCSRGAGGTSDIELDSLGLWNRVLSVEEIKALSEGNNNLD